MSTASADPLLLVLVVLLVGGLWHPAGVGCVVGTLRGRLERAHVGRREGLEVRQLVEAATLVGLDELIDPLVRVANHFLAKLLRDLVHRLACLNGSLLHRTTTRRLSGHQRLGVCPYQFDRL